MDFEEMAEAHRRALSKKTYEELEAEVDSLKKELVSTQTALNRMSVLLQESVESALRLARERITEESVSLE